MTKQSTLGRALRPALIKLAILSALLLTAFPAFADISKLSGDLLSVLSNPLGSANLIVQFKTAPSSLDLLQITLLGGTIQHQYSSIPAVAVNLPLAQVLTLANLLNVSFITPDRMLLSSLDYTAAAVNASTALQYGLDGSGVGVAVIDSGIYEHPDLQNASGTASRVVYRESFVPHTQNDDFGHGTHVAGIVGGNGKSSSGPHSTRLLRGIAPNANLIDLRVLYANGASNDSVVLHALDRAIQLKSKYNIRCAGR